MERRTNSIRTEQWALHTLELQCVPHGDGGLLRPDQPSNRPIVGSNRGRDVEWGAFPRTKPERQCGCVGSVAQRFEHFQESRSILADEDAERLANQEALAQVQELGCRAVGFDDRRVQPGHHISVGHRLEELPILGGLFGKLCLNLLETTPEFDELFLRAAEFLEQGFGFPECSWKKLRLSGFSRRSTLEASQTLLSRGQLQFE
jgi:hypothetical protein